MTIVAWSFIRAVSRGLAERGHPEQSGSFPGERGTLGARAWTAVGGGRGSPGRGVSLDSRASWTRFACREGSCWRHEGRRSELRVAFGARPLQQLRERVNELLDEVGAARCRGGARRPDDAAAGDGWHRVGQHASDTSRTCASFPSLLVPATLYWW